MTNEGQGTRTKLLEINNVSKSFPGVKAFSNISFDLFAGEVHCIVGENGAGKSTFIKILSGALRPDEGRITICGTELGFVTPSIAQQLGIQTIYQETTLVPSLSIAENMFLGSEVTGKLTFVNFAHARAKTQELLDSLEVDIDPKELVENLGIAERQVVQIAKALMKQARILIMDEPTASFGRNEIIEAPRSRQADPGLRRGHHLHLPSPRRGLHDRRPDHCLEGRDQGGVPQCR